VIARTAIFNVKSLVGPWPFVMHGVTNADAKYIVDKANLGALKGRLPTENEPECVITAPVAKNLSLELGSTLLKPGDEKNYSPFPVRIVGILQSEEWFAFMPYEYLKAHHFPPVDVLMLFAPDQREQRRLDAWAEESLKGQKAITYTYPTLERDSDESFRILFRILNLVIGLLVTVITIMMAMLINIYLSQRTVEFGLLQAIGLVKSHLVRRAIKEAYLIVAIGWALGVAAAYVLLSTVRATLMEPRGFYIDPLDAMAYAYTIPIPIAILAASAITVWVRFKRFDPISVVERRIA
jgi:ABC-type lipoprotein release transport system permease subunit